MVNCLELNNTAFNANFSKKATVYNKIYNEMGSLKWFKLIGLTPLETTNGVPIKTSVYIHWL